MTFKIRRLNLEHKAKFSLRGHASLSRSIISTYQEKTPQYQQVIRFKRQPLSFFDVFAALVTRSLIVSLVVLTPVAHAHAKAKVKKRKIVNITFDAASPETAAVKAPVTQDSKIARSLKPVDRYADDSADQDIADDTSAEVIPFDVDPAQTIASVVLRPQGPISPEAAISDSFLDETPLQVNNDIPMRAVEAEPETEMLEETDIAFVEAEEEI